jgi:hypothetical protein
MKVKDLLRLWESVAAYELTDEWYSLKLPVQEAAKLHALAELYPRRSMDEIITGLLSAALADVESGLPYVGGPNIVAMDEEGDPLYEDVGPTPRYLDLIKKHMDNYSLQKKDAQ